MSFVYFKAAPVLRKLPPIGMILLTALITSSLVLKRFSSKSVDTLSACWTTATLTLSVLISRGSITLIMKSRTYSMSFLMLSEPSIKNATSLLPLSATVVVTMEEKKEEDYY